MRATLDASLCIPKDDPVNLDVNLSGDPKLSLTPLELELPGLIVQLPTIAVTAALVVLPPPAPTTFTLTVDLGTLQINPNGIKIGLHADPNAQPLTLDLNLDQTEIKAVLEGCLLLNSGQPPTIPPPPTRRVVPVIQEVKADRHSTRLYISGQGFDGQGQVNLTDQKNAPVQVTGYPPPPWNDNKITCQLQAPLAPGVYAAVVITGQGDQSLPFMFQVF